MKQANSSDKVKQLLLSQVNVFKKPLKDNIENDLPKTKVYSIWWQPTPDGFRSSKDVDH